WGGGGREGSWPRGARSWWTIIPSDATSATARAPSTARRTARRGAAKGLGPTAGAPAGVPAAILAPPERLRPPERFPVPGAGVLAERSGLALDDLRRHEHEQLAVLVRDAAVLEQPAEEGNLPEERDPELRVGLLDDEDAADDRRPAVGDDDVRLGPLRIDARRAGGGLDRRVRRVVRHLDVHQDGPLRGDLRGDLQLQRGRHELHRDLGGRRVDDRDPDALLDLGFLVVPGRDLRR